MRVFRNIAAAERARNLDASDESTISTSPKECLDDFPYIKELRKEQKTCLRKFGSWKGSFCHSGNRLREEFDFPTVSTSSKSGSQFWKVSDNNSFAVGFGHAPGQNGTT